MNAASDNLICRHKFTTQSLVDTHPPKLKNKNKKIVYQIACPPGCIHSGEIVFSRWRKITLPVNLSSSSDRTEFEERYGYFEYEPSHEKNDEVEWYLNFAHCDLFCAYSGSLLAQDEMQVAEHPALGSLREALLDAGIDPFTVEAGEPTPILIRGVERRCAIATDASVENARPYGLYGNNFARATAEAIELATKPLNPPTVTNIIAMEAPSNGYGVYTQQEIRYILDTAFTGFATAKVESCFESAQEQFVIIHTGFWGCGAYGGNRILMALLQLLAARLAQVNRLVFHTGVDAKSAQDFATAQHILNENLAPVGSNVEVSTLLVKIQALGFQWGISDGN